MTPIQALHYEALRARLCPRQVLGTRRDAAVVRVRDMAILRAYLDGASKSEIARHIGRDRTTVVHSIKKQGVL